MKHKLYVLLYPFVVWLKQSTGWCEPPPGMWITTNGKRYRYETSTFQSHILRRTRAGAVRFAWLVWRDRQKAAAIGAGPWVQVSNNRKAKS